MKKLKIYKTEILKSDLPDEVKKELINAIECDTTDKLRIFSVLLQFYDLSKNLYDYIDNKFNE